MKKVSMLEGAIAVLFLYSTAFPDTWYVHPDSTLNSIQAGIDLCSTGDTVLVGPGTYTENINFNGMAITVTSEYGADTTVIDGGSPAHPDTGSVVLFISGEDTTSILEGFTLTNGSGTYVPAYGFLVGGGVYCNNSAPKIKDNIITGNGGDTVLAGGGINCDISSSAVIVNNIITHNEAGYGGGIECYYSSPTIHDNTIDSNTAHHGGGIAYDHGGPSDVTDNKIRWNISDSIAGGIECNDCSPNIIGNIITGNRAGQYGGGIRCWEASPNIKHNVITDNIALYGYGGGGIRCQEFSTPNIDSCTISNNTGGDGIYCRTGANPVIHYCNVTDNVGYGLVNTSSWLTLDADSNWWGDATGPYHPTANPGGLGDTVSDYVDFDPWLTDSVQWVGIEEQKIVKPIETHDNLGATIFSGPLLLPEGKKCKVFDITGRVVVPDKMRPGIYFIEIDGQIVQKVVKVR